MRAILKNDGVQVAIVAIAIGVGLSALGFSEGALLVGAGAAYLIGKLQHRPDTIEYARELENMIDEVDE